MREKPILFKAMLWVLVALSVVGCSAFSPSAAMEPAMVVEAPAGVSELPVDLSVEEVHTLFTGEEIVVLDVREPWEYAEGHIPGTTLIPLGELPDRIAEIPEDEVIVIVCRSGNRSSRAQRFLSQQGFDSVHNMLGGMLAWEDAGYTMEP
ncbi:MAG: rhodanese-like domain-containing protein [Anaerolineales bacterium]